MINKTINLITVETDSNWLLDNIEPWNWSNAKRYVNYLAIATRNEDGTFSYTWCKMSNEGDEYFNVNNVKEGDVLMAGYKDKRKSYGKKLYYKVIEKTDDTLVLYRDTTYRKALKYVDETCA